MGVIIVESDDERQHDFRGGNKLSFFERTIYVFPDWEAENVAAYLGDLAGRSLEP